MNRIGVVTSLLTTVPASYTKGQLAIIDTLGAEVKATQAGPYSPPTMLELFVGLTDGSAKQVGTINPLKFEFATKAYVAPVGRTVRVGYNGSSGNIVQVDPTLTANLGKFGTLTVWYNNNSYNSTPSWGESFSRDVQIASGDTTATILAKLVTAATEIATAINAKYGAGSVTLTSDVASADKYLQFAFAAPGVNASTPSVTIDGIFDGTLVGNTVEMVISKGTAAEVKEAEKEAAILDGYNPNQRSMYQSFDLDNYYGAVAGTNYDAIEVRTTLPKEYESPDAPSGWNVSFTLYTPNTTPGTVGTVGAAIASLLQEVKDNHQLSKATADATYVAQ